LPASKNRGQTRRLLVQSRTPQKSFIFLLEEKKQRAPKKKIVKSILLGGER